MSLDEKNNVKKQNSLNKSIAYFNESIEIFKKFNALNDLQSSYSFISKANRAKGNYKESLEYFEKSYTLKSSIFSNKNKKQIENLESQREIDLRDKQIIIQNLKIKNDSRKVYLLFTISTAVAILLGLFFWLYLSKRKTNVQLKEKNKTISNINTQKDKFFSIIAHDLRGPFNGFLGLTELLVNDLDFMTNEEIQFAAGSMKSSANNLNRLLENLLEWSRMEQGLIAFKPQEYKLKSVVDECVLTFKDIAQKKAIKINYSIDEEITVFADNNILHAVVRNILSNAVKFTPKGGNVIIQVNEDDTNTTISITDSGIGMNPKMVENLFRLDVQTNRKGTNDEPSTGLGLILCKEFVEKHNGEIWLESVEEQGTTFYFSFPKALR
jgi:signal transduction histidine kinase